MTATTIKLYGEIGKKFGRRYDLHVETPAEAIRALCAQLPGFERYMMEANADRVQFACYNGGTVIGEQELHLPAKRSIKVVPVAVGAKNGGLTQVIIGAAIIVAAIYFAPAGAAAGAGGTAAGGTAGAGVAGGGTAVAGGISYSSIAFSMGVAMVLGGVTQMLTPQAKGLSTADSPENGSSYMFNGPVNITRQGAPVPLLYGELYVGSATVSAGIYSEDQA